MGIEPAFLVEITVGPSHARLAGWLPDLVSDEAVRAEMVSAYRAIFGLPSQGVCSSASAVEP